MKTSTLGTHKILSVVLLALTAACGGDGDGEEALPGDDPGPDTGCKITLSGELSGTYGCHATAGHTDGEDGSVLGAIGTGLGSPIRAITIAAELPADSPAIKEYSAGDFRTAGVILMTSDNHLFVATRGANEGDHGTLGTFKVTGLDLIDGAEGGKIWNLHGSFSASLVDVVTQKTVTLKATF